MSGTRRGHGFMLCWISDPHGQNFFPVLPVAVGNLHGYRRTDGAAMPYAGKDVSGVCLDAHATAATIPLLTAPQFPVDEVLVDFEPCRESLHQRDQGLAVRLTRS